MRRTFARITLALFVLTLWSSVLAATAQASVYTVVVNGSTAHNTQSEIREGQLMVAIRPFVEAMGGGVSWLAEEWRATVHYDGSQIAFWVGTRTVYHNGTRLTSPVAPYIKNGSTMVPAWWLSVRLGAQVRFTGSTLYVDTDDSHAGASPRPGPVNGHPLMKANYVFPFAQGVRYDPYYDSWGDGRYYDGSQFTHEGIDIMARKGTPIVAVASGKVVRYGWNTLGGYRLTVQLDDYPEYRFYYAHMDRYAPGMYLGARIHQGQVIGYVGNTGEGPERTEGKFVDHLHFGIYAPDGAINPFSFLQYWEQNKVQN